MRRWRLERCVQVGQAECIEYQKCTACIECTESIRCTYIAYKLQSVLQCTECAKVNGEVESGNHVRGGEVECLVCTYSIHSVQSIQNVQSLQSV